MDRNQDEFVTEMVDDALTDIEARRETIDLSMRVVILTLYSLLGAFLTLFLVFMVMILGRSIQGSHGITSVALLTSLSAAVTCGLNIAGANARKQLEDRAGRAQNIFLTPEVSWLVAIMNSLIVVAYFILAFA